MQAGLNVFLHHRDCRKKAIEKLHELFTPTSKVIVCYKYCGFHKIYVKAKKSYHLKEKKEYIAPPLQLYVKNVGRQTCAR